jgi:hypothetical protein
MTIIKHIIAIVIIIILHQIAVAWAEDAPPPAALPLQQESQPIEEQPSETAAQEAPLVETIQSSPSDTSSNPDAFIGPKMGFIDTLHGKISERLLTTAVWLDSFFEDERVQKEINQSYIRFRYDLFHENRAAATYRPTVSMRLALPQLEKKAHLVVSAEQPEPVSSTPVPAGTTRDRIGVTDERNVTTAVHYILRATEEQNFVVRSGAQFSHGSPVLFVAPRYRYFVPLAAWGFRFTQEAVWKTDTKWQMNTLFDLERQLPRAFFFRSSLGGTWLDGTNGYFYSLSFSLRQPIDPKHALDYGWINSYQTRPVYELSEILFIIRYRQNVWRDWFFFEVAPQIRFPRSGNFDGTPGILFRFEMFFGQKTWS